MVRSHSTPPRVSKSLKVSKQNVSRSNSLFLRKQIGKKDLSGVSPIAIQKTHHPSVIRGTPNTFEASLGNDSRAVQQINRERASQSAYTVRMILQHELNERINNRSVGSPRRAVLSFCIAKTSTIFQATLVARRLDSRIHQEIYQARCDDKPNASR